MASPPEVAPQYLSEIASILAAGYLRYRRRLGRQDSLDTSANPSLHMQAVNGSEKGEPVGDDGTQSD